MSLEIRARAAAVLEQRKRMREREHADEGLLDFVTRISPKFERPDHLSDLVEAIERTRRDEVFAVVHAPPRHAKTETVLHAIAWLLKQNPELKIGYASYQARIARNKSGRAKQLAIRAGVEIDRSKRAAGHWATTAGGGLFSAGRGGPFTGEGFDLIIVDDPIKNRAEAESEVIRDGLEEWFTSTAVTRLEPGGSILVMQTRWHEDDLPGRLLAQEGEWESIHLPAIDDEGNALWPTRWPVTLLEKRRRKLLEMDWWSLFQGTPRPRGGNLFQQPHFYRELPSVFSEGGGLDFAYTVKTRSDWNVLVEGVSHKNVLYITNVVRAQAKSNEWREVLKSRRVLKRHARWVAIVSGVERGVVDLLNDEAGLDIEMVSASTDKYMRAQPAAAAWNDGRILVPAPPDNDPETGESTGDSPEWLAPFLGEVGSFTGVKDKRDDQIDGLAALYAAAIDPDRVPDAVVSADALMQANEWEF